MPDLDISNLVVVEGTRNAELQDGVGHETGTVLPGQQGVSTVVGKSFTFGAPSRETP
ncbi:hypothetical protein [Aeromicrobium sp. UC242_57]|uniref:hypothetical protein n=1 Tax=Aeromicrobium sp. UC242_57 TaxID=3374624 RepID=UPI003796691C